MRYKTCLLALLLTCIARGATTSTAPAEIGRDELQRIYQRELREKFDRARFEDLLSAHRLIEEYFDAGSAKRKGEIVTSLEATKVDPTILGRLTRIRLHWPALEGGSYYINEQFGQFNVKYFLGVPEKYDRATPWPLVVKLPTAHAFITDPPPDGNEVARIYSAWIAEELARHPDALVLMPLLNLDELYGPSTVGMNSVMQSLLHAYDRVNLDPARVYLIGHSMSANAVWNLGLHFPAYFAAINPLAGAASADWQRLRLINLRNVLTVVWHDADDMVLNVKASRSIVEAMRKQKLDVQYEETKDLGHAPPQMIVDKLYDLAHSRTRSLYPIQVWLQSNRPETRFNRSDWLQVYQALRPGEDRRLLFRHGSGNMVVNANAYRIDANIPAPNQIAATADNVALRIYLNDQMVDLSKPVTITVNRKVRFEGPVTRSIGEMLKDQVFLGRGWRYFTAIVDIDLDPPTSRPLARPLTRPTTRTGVAR